MLHRSSVGWLLALALFASAWTRVHPPLPQLPNSDLFTHLSVAEHVLAGQGFVTGIAYPVSLVFPFARCLPQPLIHRQPGYPVLLLGPTWLGSGEPTHVLAWVHRLHLGLMIGLAWLGLILLRRVGNCEVVPAWWLVLLLSPSLGMTAGWGLIEIPTALLLLWLWHRLRPDLAASLTGKPPPSRAMVDGGLAGVLTLLRLDLVWIPLLWWGLARRRVLMPAGLVALTAWMLVTGPWCYRNARLTGDPFFNLQARTEHLKETPVWPGYSIYRSLSPEPILKTAVNDPALLLTKARVGIRFFTGGLGRWLPWSLWGVMLLLTIWCWRRGGAISDGSLPPVLALATLLLLMLQYAFFSHSLRHLVVILPVVALELCLWLGQHITRRWPRLRRRWRGTLLAIGVVLCHLATPLHLPGWAHALDEARQAEAGRGAGLRQMANAPPGPVFCDSAALLWYAGRDGVWLPEDAAVTTRIRQLLPALAAAPTIAILNAAPDTTAGTAFPD